MSSLQAVVLYGGCDTKIHPLPLCAAEIRRRHPCSAPNVVNSGPFAVSCSIQTACGTINFQILQNVGENIVRSTDGNVEFICDVTNV